MATTINMSATIPDAQVSNLLLAFNSISPQNSGETNGNYVKRIIKGILTDLIKQQLILQAQAAIPGSISDPGVTVS